METGGIAREDPRTGVRSSGCETWQESAKKAPESGAVVAVFGCMWYDEEKKEMIRC